MNTDRAITVTISKDVIRMYTSFFMIRLSNGNL